MVRESAIQNERELGAIAMEMPMRDAFGSSLIKLLDSVFSGLSGCERSGGSVASIINLATHDYILCCGVQPFTTMATCAAAGPPYGREHLAHGLHLRAAFWNKSLMKVSKAPPPFSINRSDDTNPR